MSARRTLQRSPSSRWASRTARCPVPPHPQVPPRLCVQHTGCSIRRHQVAVSCQDIILGVTTWCTAFNWCYADSELTQAASDKDNMDCDTVDGKLLRAAAAAACGGAHVPSSALQCSASHAGATSSQDDNIAMVKAFCLKRKQVRCRQHQHRLSQAVFHHALRLWHDSGRHICSPSHESHGRLQVDMMDIMAEFVDVSTAVLTATIIPRLKAEGLLAELPSQPDTCVCVPTCICPLSARGFGATASARLLLKYQIFDMN